MSKPSLDSRRIGRPPSQAARSHTTIMDAVHQLLQETSARDLTMEAVAKRAKVGKPTLYKWWPSKAALIMAMFNERLVGKPVSSSASTVGEALRAKLRRLINDFNGLFGKVMADLIGEGQSDPKLLQDLHQHISRRRIHTVADIQRGKESGEFLPGTDAELAGRYSLWSLVLPAALGLSTNETGICESTPKSGIVRYEGSELY